MEIKGKEVAVFENVSVNVNLPLLLSFVNATLFCIWALKLQQEALHEHMDTELVQVAL